MIVVALLLFWLIALIGVMCTALLALSVRHKQRRPALWAGFSLVLLAASAIQLWGIWGACLLPHSNVIAYRPGMALCPGQSMLIGPIEIPLPRPGRDL